MEIYRVDEADDIVVTRQLTRSSMAQDHYHNGQKDSGTSQIPVAGNRSLKSHNESTNQMQKNNQCLKLRKITNV